MIKRVILGCGVFVVLCVTGIDCFAQQEQQWMQALESPRFERRKLREVNELDDFLRFDFSMLLMPRSEFLGFIGEGYKRIHIFFTSIERNEGGIIYTLTGRSEVGNNRCEFEGTIKLTQVRQFKEFHLGLDDELEGKIKAQGLLVAEYSFEENNKQPNSGLFSGILTTFWYVDKSGTLKYDDIEMSYSDRYCNNQFVGRWKGYKSKTAKICNWGEFRIPFSGDLDIGAGYFSPNPKYKSAGWADYNP